MVVMAIMAMLSALGIAALVGINNNALADKAAEGILNQLREAQNKSISVASKPNDPDSFPLAWGVKIVAGTGAGSVSGYYINPTSYDSTTLPQSSDQVAYTIKSVKKLSDTATSIGVAYLNYSTPFSKFTLRDGSNKVDACHDSGVVDAVCDQPSGDGRPYSIKFNGNGRLDDGVVVVMEFRGVEKTITVGANGEAYISD